MSKTNMETYFYYANICKHKHEKEHDEAMVQDHA